MYSFCQKATKGGKGTNKMQQTEDAMGRRTPHQSPPQNPNVVVDNYNSN
jgi:hypothetical protein